MNQHKFNMEHVLKGIGLIFLSKHVDPYKFTNQLLIVITYDLVRKNNIINFRTYHFNRRMILKRRT
jgi:hypothetical protein